MYLNMSVLEFEDAVTPNRLLVLHLALFMINSDVKHWQMVLTLWVCLCFSLVENVILFCFTVYYIQVLLEAWIFLRK